jgi:hypothetical protein
MEPRGLATVAKIFVQLPERLAGVIQLITLKTRPVSIFLFGSRARDDFLDLSDYEFGVLYAKDQIPAEVDFRNLITQAGCGFYHYEIDAFILGTLDLPFEQSIFIRSAIIGGKTVWGEQIIELMEYPPITVVSLMREIKFQLGRASDALVCFQLGHISTSARLFMKSCLWGTRCLSILKSKDFPISYLAVIEAARKLDLGEYGDLPKKALSARLSSEVEKPDLFRNVRYLSRFIERQILAAYRSSGDCFLL